LRSRIRRTPPHRHTYNHAFYFLRGTCKVQIGEQTWDIEPGTLVKVPAHEQHSVTNTGTDDLIFLVVYDPPPADDGFPELSAEAARSNGDTGTGRAVSR
jgi:quercetin dioxygenase-like cupin family protein